MRALSRSARRRAVAAVPGVLGAALIIRPEAVLALVCGSGAHPKQWIVRLLGLRMVGQAAVTAVRPTDGVELIGVATDLTHAASMVLLYQHDPRYRRPAAASAVVAMVSAASSSAMLRP